MAYRTVEIANFGGLDCRRDPQDAAPIRAIDMLNVDVDAGRIRKRPGTTKLISQSTTTEWQSLVTFKRRSIDQPYLITIVPSTGQLRAYNAATGALITQYTVPGADLPASIFTATMVGVPTSDNRMYITVGGATNVTFFSAAGFADTVLPGDAKFAAVQYPDNRYVRANFSTSPTYSRVYWSAPNDPVTVPVDDFVDRMPGDGEEIVGLENFRDFLIAFKQGAFYVFYGNSTDAVGGTVFNYRTVRHNLATPAYAGKVTCSGREGVYFIAKDGVYLTDGGYPRKVSGALDPLFVGSDNAGYFTAVDEIGGGTFPNLDLEYVGGRLYLRLGDSSMFVYDPQADAWMYWYLLAGRSMSIQGITPVLLAGGDEEIPYFLTVGGTSPNIRSVISYLDPTVTGDEEHAITAGVNSRYRTNFMDLGPPGALKTIRATEIEGYTSAKPIGWYPSNLDAHTGLDFYTDVTTDPLSAGSATWPEYLIGQGFARQAFRGRNFSLGIGFENVGETTAWAIHRVLAHLKAGRPAGVYATVTSTGE